MPKQILSNSSIWILHIFNGFLWEYALAISKGLDESDSVNKLDILGEHTLKQNEKQPPNIYNLVSS